MEQASELFRRNEDHELLSGLRAAGLEGEVQHAEQLTVQFAEHQEQLEEVWTIISHSHGFGGGMLSASEALLPCCLSQLLFALPHPRLISHDRTWCQGSGGGGMSGPR